MRGRSDRRRTRWFLALGLMVSLPPIAAYGQDRPSRAAAAAEDVRGDRWIAGHRDELVGLYEQLHTRPELSFQEHETARRIAAELNKAGVEVTTGVGKLGVVGILKNGQGPVVLVRTDMDALPVTEETGVPYASRVRATDKAGRPVGVMH